MEYCRSLKFEQEPNYKTCINMFDCCLQRHNLDPKIPDYTWKQNRLHKDKEALKNSVLNVIRKKPQRAAGENDGMLSGQAQALNSNTPQMYSGQQHAGGQVAGGFDATANQQYGQANNAGTSKQPTGAAIAKQQSKPKDTRGSEFKKSAQQMLGKQGQIGEGR